MNSPCCTLIINENFSLTFNASMYDVKNLIKDTTKSGCFVANFNQVKQFDDLELTDEAKRILNTPNAGGSSIESETLSFEMVKKVFNAKLLKTETEIEYWPQGGPITDYACHIFGSIIGISVARGMNFKAPFTIKEATKLLTKKLNGIVQSSKTSLVKWDKQILNIWVLSKQDADTTFRAWETIDLNLKSNTLLLITIAEKSSEIFTNKAKYSKNKKFKKMG